MVARPIQPRRTRRSRADGPAIVPAFALVAATWLELFVTQWSWPGDAGVTASFAVALLLVTGFDRAGGSVSAGVRRRRSSALCVARRCPEWAGWCLLGMAMQPWLARLALEGFLLVSGEVAMRHRQPELGALRVVSLLILAPTFEEVLYRGLLFKALARAGHAGLAILVTAAFFALPHAGQLGMLAVLLAGLVLGTLRACTGRLAPCIAMHVGFNITAVVGVMPPFSSG